MSEKRPLTLKELDAFFSLYPEFKKTMKQICTTMVETIKPMMDAFIPVLEIMMETIQNIMSNLPEDVREYLIKKATEDMKNDGTT